MTHIFAHETPGLIHTATVHLHWKDQIWLSSIYSMLTIYDIPTWCVSLLLCFCRERFPVSFARCKDATENMSENICIEWHMPLCMMSSHLAKSCWWLPKTKIRIRNKPLCISVIYISSPRTLWECVLHATCKPLIYIYIYMIFIYIYIIACGD